MPRLSAKEKAFIASMNKKFTNFKQKPPYDPSKKIPLTLEECFAALDVWLSPDDQMFFKGAYNFEKNALTVHFTLGQHIRYEWGLWWESPLNLYLRAEHDVHHPDDMSHYILVQYAKSAIPTAWERILR